MSQPDSQINYLYRVWAQHVLVDWAVQFHVSMIIARASERSEPKCFLSSVYIANSSATPSSWRTDKRCWADRITVINIHVRRQVTQKVCLTVMIMNPNFQPCKPFNTFFRHPGDDRSWTFGMRKVSRYVRITFKVYGMDNRRLARNLMLGLCWYVVDECFCITWKYTWNRKGTSQVWNGIFHAYWRRPVSPLPRTLGKLTDKSRNRSWTTIENRKRKSFSVEHEPNRNSLFRGS